MNLSYATWLTVSGMVALLVAWLSWQRRAAPGAPALCVLMLTLAVWSLTYAVYWLSFTPETRAFSMIAPVLSLGLSSLIQASTVSRLVMTGPSATSA